MAFLEAAFTRTVDRARVLAGIRSIIDKESGRADGQGEREESNGYKRFAALVRHSRSLSLLSSCLNSSTAESDPLPRAIFHRIYSAASD